MHKFKKIALFFALTILWFAPIVLSPSIASATLFNARSLTGGTTTSLDGINGRKLKDSDRAVVYTTTGVYFYYLDADLAATENSPTFIRPDSNAGDKTWVQIPIPQASITLNTNQFLLSGFTDIKVAATALNLLGDCELVIDEDETLNASTGNVSFNSTVTLHPTSGNVITLGAYNFTAYNIIDLGRTQWLDINGIGRPTFHTSMQLRSEWFGNNVTGGTTDMTDEIQYAVTAGNVLLDGTYKITADIEVLSGRKITSVSRDTKVNCWGCDGFTITGSAIDSKIEICNFQLLSYSAVGVARPVTNLGITATGGPYLTNPLFYSIDVHDMYFDGWATAVYFYDVWDSDISKNQFDYNHVGIELKDLCVRNNIIGNKFTVFSGVTTTTACIKLTYDSYAPEGIVISGGNKMAGSAYGVYNLQLCAGVSITNNEFDNTISCVFTNPTEGMIISDNYYMRASGASPAIDFTDCNQLSIKNSTISGNYIINAGTGYGISIGQYTSTVDISGNIINTASANSILLDPLTEKISVNNNIGYCVSEVAAPTIYISGINNNITNNVNMRTVIDTGNTRSSHVNNNSLSRKETSLDAIPTTGTWNQGDIIYKSYLSSAYTATAQILSQQPDGWVCNKAGTFSTSSETGNTTIDTAIISNIDTTYFRTGEYVTVSTGFNSSTASMQILGKTSSTLTLDTLASSSTAGATIATPDPIFSVLGNGERLLSVTNVPFNSIAAVTLYTVPTGYRFIPTKAIVVVGADAGATVVSIGKVGALTDFLPNQTLSNLDAQYDVGILQPIPNATTILGKSYAAGTVIQMDVTTNVGGASNTVYLYGMLY